MEDYTIEVIKRCDSQSLISFIAKYDSYTVDSVTLSILELKRRRHDGFSSLSDKISKFCETNNVKDKDELIDNFFKAKEVGSYE